VLAIGSVYPLAPAVPGSVVDGGSDGPGMSHFWRICCVPCRATVAPVPIGRGLIVSMI